MSQCQVKYLPEVTYLLQGVFSFLGTSYFVNTGLSKPFKISFMVKPTAGSEEVMEVEKASDDPESKVVFP